ncbi:hypothetical protein A9Q84_15965 [Halobacteriovorax marinus]|uniref:Response regulatory domain-containing protein n=1 Tax=Halobacteriovorax marinus TaxID=97084 RepID=A0A1Y5FAJ7_9BACT|nr:hypothetical protein A9Q84_15965 [Halobacteriovorax marinus]
MNTGNKMDTDKFVLSMGTESFLTTIKETLDYAIEFKLVTAISFSHAVFKLRNQSFVAVIIEDKENRFDALKMYKFMNDKYEKIPPSMIVSYGDLKNKHLISNEKCKLEFIELPQGEDLQELHIHEKILPFVQRSMELQLDISHLLKNQRVLVVDDSKINRLFLKDFILNHTTHKTIKIDEAKDGFQALQMIKENKYDLVLLDYIMPKLEGNEILLIIRNTFSKKQLPVIVISSQDKLDIVKELINYGVNDYITRPINLNALLKKITQVLK